MPTTQQRPTSERDPLRSLQYAEEEVGVSQVTLRRLIRSGELPAVKVGGSIRIRQSALDAIGVPLGPRSPK